MELPVISGELLMLLADVVLVSPSRRRYHKSLPAFVSDTRIVELGGALPIPVPRVLRDARIVFVFTDELGVAAPWLRAAPAWRALMMHNSDDAPDEAEVRALLAERPAAVMFAQNLGFHHERAFVLPIGVANSMWRHGNIDVWKKWARKISESRTTAARPITLLRNAMGDNHPSRAAYKRLSRSDLTEAPFVSDMDGYAAQLASSSFVLCPRGNGVDTHRFWESLVCGATPVLLAGEPFLEQLSRTFSDDGVCVPWIAAPNESALATMELKAAADTGLASQAWRRILHLPYWADRVTRAMAKAAAAAQAAATAAACRLPPRDRPATIPIVFTHIGPSQPPGYTRHALEQARMWNPLAPIILLVSASSVAAATALLGNSGAIVLDADSPDVTGRCPALARFRSSSKLDSSFRSGFWRYTTERLLVLSAWARRAGYSEFVHLENDTLLYAHVATEFASWLTGGGVTSTPARGMYFTTMHTGSTHLANVLIVNDTALLAQLADSVIANCTSEPNEMRMCYMFAQQHRDRVGLLPATPADARAYGAGAVVDAAPYGQYLGGPDPRNHGLPEGTRAAGFVNNHAGFCVADAVRITWELVQRPCLDATSAAAQSDTRATTQPLWRPVVSDVDAATSSHGVPLLSLHIHSKVLAAFRSDVAAPPPIPRSRWYIGPWERGRNVCAACADHVIGAPPQSEIIPPSGERAMEPLRDADANLAPPGFDVVIPCHEKDEQVLPYVLAGLHRFARRLGTIYVIAQHQFPVIAAGGAVWIDEATPLLPFRLHDVRSALPQTPAAQARAGWYFQQLLKLHAVEAIPQLRTNFMVWDGDSILRTPQDFVRGDDGTGDASLQLYLDTASEYHAPYFTHMAALGVSRACSDSGVAHHMMMEKSVLAALVEHVQRHWTAKRVSEDTTSPELVPFWRCFMEAVDPSEAAGSGASEYELYFHFAVAAQTAAVQNADGTNAVGSTLPHVSVCKRLVLRKLRQVNAHRLSERCAIDADIVSVHSYSRDSDFV